MRRLVLTEKPSVARDIASVLDVRDNKDTHLQGKSSDGNYYTITWCFGHLLEIGAPEADGKWSLEKLPIIPKKFELRPIRKEGEKPVADGDEPVENDYVKRLNVIRKLAYDCDEIVVATDAGREGQGIFENVYRYLNLHKKTLRLWISSLTEDSIRQGFENLMDNTADEFVNLGKAAWERSTSDWLVGINATRAFTLATDYTTLDGKKQVMSLGRVQTPTLCMICDRYEEHVNFKSEPYWYIEGFSEKDGMEIRWRGDVRYDNESEGNADLQRIKNTGVIAVKSIEKERKNEAPPLLHDIASLQKKANAMFGMTMDQTLAAAQTLYEHKLTTYPRTGSRYIPEDVFETVPGLLKKIENHPEFGKFAQALSQVHLNRRSVNDGKITDHHAIIITGNAPKSDELTEAEKNVYDLIITRFLEAFAPISVADVTTVSLECDDIKFSVKGRKMIAPGWRAIAAKKEAAIENAQGSEGETGEESDSQLTPLPAMKEGEMLKIKTVSLIEDKTRPKPLLTDATLLTQMENAGKKSDDKQVATALKDIGIGTPATRHEILETLARRQFVTRRKRKIIPTELGLEVYHAVRDLELANVEMTARWEIALGNIVDGKGGEKEYENDIRSYTVRVVHEILKSPNVKKVRDKIEERKITCPKCGSNIRLGEKSAWCKNCGFTVWRNVAGKTLNDNSMRALLAEGHTSLLKGFVSRKTGKEFNAIVNLEQDGSLTLEFENKRNS